MYHRLLSLRQTNTNVQLAMSAITHLNQLDPSKSYTYADYLTWQFQERVELIKGKLFKMSPSPKRKHQSCVVNLVNEIHSFLKGHSCKVYIAPFDVPLPKEASSTYTVVQPDLCVVCDPNKLDEAGCVGAPDLIVEILSPATTKKDKTDKYDLYQESGVLEYWIVYPEEEFIEAFVLKGKHYQRKGIYLKGEQMTTDILKGFNLNVDDVFEE